MFGSLASGKRSAVFISETSFSTVIVTAAIFPRINIRDPYKRLGISREASEEEIQSARNFLVQKYAVHQPSLEAIESAHDKIIMQKFYERKKPKINIKKKVRDVTQSHVVQAVISRFSTPSTNFIIKTSITFVILGAVTVLFPTEEGPTLQVAISLITTIYFIHDRLKSQMQAFLYGYVLWYILETIITQFRALFKDHLSFNNHTIITCSKHFCQSPCCYSLLKAFKTLNCHSC